MLFFKRKKTNQDKNFSHCYGCGLCTLVCPVWHQSRDVVCTPHGHAKAMQSGGEINSDGLFSCLLCGACEPVCPENINLMQMMLELRQKTPSNISKPDSDNEHTHQNESKIYKVLLLADEALLEHTSLLSQTLKLLNQAGSNSVGHATDNACDITRALQSGVEISAQRQEDFLRSLQFAKKLIVSDGLLKITLQKWLPAMQIVSLGYVLSNTPNTQKKLGTKDLYIIESRSYNTDFEQMVSHYDKLKRRSGCHLNLDLQRLAMPTGGVGLISKTDFDANKQAQWILQGLNFERIIVESVADAVAMAKVTNKPILHLAELLSKES